MDWTDLMDPSFEVGITRDDVELAGELVVAPTMVWRRMMRLDYVKVGLVWDEVVIEDEEGVAYVDTQTRDLFVPRVHLATARATRRTWDQAGEWDPDWA